MSEIAVDMLRALHLFNLVLGMGAALYLDYRSIATLKRTIQIQDLFEIQRIHTFVSFAFAGLWVTGLILVWVRTSFDFDQFSPKLWCKLILVSVMTVNAGFIGVRVLPTLEAYVGYRLIDIPLRHLFPLTVIASISFFCWVSALIVGSSNVLKTASWDTMTSVLAALYIPVILGGIIAVSLARASLSLQAYFRRKRRLATPGYVHRY